MTRRKSEGCFRQSRRRRDLSLKCLLGVCRVHTTSSIIRAAKSNHIWGSANDLDITAVRERMDLLFRFFLILLWRWGIVDVKMLPSAISYLQVLLIHTIDLSIHLHRRTRMSLYESHCSICLLL